MSSKNNHLATVFPHILIQEYAEVNLEVRKLDSGPKYCVAMPPNSVLARSPQNLHIQLKAYQKVCTNTPCNH